ncbi:type II secretion system protein [Luedemannella flava]
MRAWKCSDLPIYVPGQLIAVPSTALTTLESPCGIALAQFGAASGFTLIELLIVIVILGVLAGAVVFAVKGIKDRGTAAACTSDKKVVEVAAEAYYASTTSTRPAPTTRLASTC